MNKIMNASKLEKGGFLIITKDTIRVEGMSGDHCVMMVGRAIASVKGVLDVDVSLGNKEATVEYDRNKTDLEEIMAAVREAGYRPLGKVEKPSS